MSSVGWRPALGLAADDTFATGHPEQEADPHGEEVDRCGAFFGQPLAVLRWTVSGIPLNLPSGILHSMPETTTIKVNRQLRNRLARLASEQQTTMAGVLERVIDRLEREAFFARIDADLVRLRHDRPEEWRSYRAESAAWEQATVADGLSDYD